MLASLPWVREAPAVYWGDLDSHGFAILDQARRALPQLRSVLMDEQALLSHRELWVEESTPYAKAELPHLTAVERAICTKLHANTCVGAGRCGWSKSA